jgi:hypothetical protein
MAIYRLVVSNPPQAAVKAEEAARQLGLTPEQFRAKAAYVVPEIWFAHPDRERSEDTARALEAAGCRVAVTWSDTLVGFPARQRVRGFSFGDTALVVQLDGSEVAIPYDEPVVAVFCRPREQPPDLVQTGRPRRTSQMLTYRESLLEAAPVIGAPREGDASVPYLDLFIANGGGAARRFTVLQNAVSFSGLGRVQPRAATNMEALVGSCTDRFARATFDRRLVGMRLRHRGNARPAGAEHRRGFSYASPGLHALLMAVGQHLEGISQPELATRLAFLTLRGEG